MPLPETNVTPRRIAGQGSAVQHELAQMRPGTHNGMPVQEVMTEEVWRARFSELMDRSVRDEANGGIDGAELDAQMRALMAMRPSAVQAQANAQATIDRREAESDAEVLRLFTGMDQIQPDVSLDQFAAASRTRMQLLNATVFDALQELREANEAFQTQQAVRPPVRRNLISAFNQAAMTESQMIERLAFLTKCLLTLKTPSGRDQELLEFGREADRLRDKLTPAQIQIATEKGSALAEQEE